MAVLMPGHLRALDLDDHTRAQAVAAHDPEPRTDGFCPLTHSDDAVVIAGHVGRVEALSVVGNLEPGAAVLVDVPADDDLCRAGMSIDVRQGLLHDAPQLLFDSVREASRCVRHPARRDAGALLETSQELRRDRGQLVLLADVGAQLVDRLAQLLHDVTHDTVKIADLVALLARQVEQPFQLERDVRQ